MITLLRMLGVLLGTLLLAALCVCGLALAVFSIPSGDSGLPQLFEWISLPSARDEVDSFIVSLEVDGPVAVASAMAAAGVVVGGLLLVLAAVAGPERLIALRSAAGDRLRARRRAIRGAVSARAERVRGPRTVRVRVRRRRLLPGAGSVRVTVRHPQRATARR